MSEAHRQAKRNKRWYLRVLLDCGHIRRTWKWRIGWANCTDCGKRGRITFIIRDGGMTPVPFDVWQSANPKR